MRRVFKLVGLFLIILLLLSVMAQGSELTKSEHTIAFTNISKTDRSLVLSLPSDAAVTYFSFDVVGPVEPGLNQPKNLSLDIGDNGTIDWS